MFRIFTKPVLRHNVRPMTMATTIPMESYLSTSWLRQHLFYLGFDLIRLQSYQKISSKMGTNAGGILKSLVSDISTFINKELNVDDSPTAQELRHLISRYCDESLSFHNISECRLFFMTVGYMMLHGDTRHLDDLTDRLVAIYLSRGVTSMKSHDNGLTDKVSSLSDKYFETCKIDRDALYGRPPSSIHLFITKHIRITLPPLPRIYNHKLLAKALVHKELYRGFLHPDHQFHKILKDNDIEPISATKILRDELSFFDGLGDYYLSQESSNLLYEFTHADPYRDQDNFGPRAYNLLKTILATNTLLSRLALAYRLHEGLDDPIVNGLFRDTYVPGVAEWEHIDLTTHQASKFRYEQEFVADYFEQYVGTLFVEQPNVAQMWINQIYSNILFSISKEHRVRSKLLLYDYNSWGVDIIGRKLNTKPQTEYTWD